MPRYPDLYPLTTKDLKEIARVRDTDAYLENGWYQSFDAYCMGEWQRSANTINKRLKREGFTSKRTKKIQRKKEQAAQSSAWIQSKYAALKGGTAARTSVSPSVSPNSDGVSPSPSRNNSKDRTKKEEGMSNEEMKNIKKDTMRTQDTKTVEAPLTQHQPNPSGEAKKSQAELRAEFDRIFNS